MSRLSITILPLIRSRLCIIEGVKRLGIRDHASRTARCRRTAANLRVHLVRQRLEFRDDLRMFVGERSRPSITGSAGTTPPAMLTAVGSKSMVPATASQTLPGAIFPGHHATVGTRTPPSHVLPLPPRKGNALPPSVPLISHGPLSLVKTTSVRSSSFSSRRLSSAPQHPAR